MNPSIQYDEDGNARVMNRNGDWKLTCVNDGCDRPQEKNCKRCGTCRRHETPKRKADWQNRRAGYGPCEVFGCFTPGNSRSGGVVFCTTHRNNGPDYVVGPGMKPDDRAGVYLLVHPEYQAIKVGVWKLGTHRIRTHHRNGWLTVKTWDQGLTAAMAKQQVETPVARRGWRDAGYPIGVPSEMDGATETVPMSFVSIDEARRLIDSLVREARGY